MVRTNFSADFLDFVIFDCNFAKIVAAARDGNENHIVYLLKKNDEKQNAEKLVEIGQ